MATAPIQIQVKRPVAREEPHQKAYPEDYDRIQCRDCGHSYPALDGPALLYSLKSSCPHCGGGFELVL